MTDTAELEELEELERAEADSLAPAPAAQGEGDPWAGRRIEVRLVRWGEVAERTQEGIRERILPGAFRGTDPSRVTLESQRHNGELVGVAESVTEGGQDARAVFRVSRTRAGDELLQLVSDGVLRDASIVFVPSRSRPAAGGIIERAAVLLRRVAILPNGAYPSATVLAVRGAPMSDVIPGPVSTTGDPAAAVADLAPVLSRMDGIDARLAELAALAATPAARAPHELARHERLSDYAGAVWTGDADPLELWRALELQRTVADQITDNNAGVLPPSWLSDVKRIVDLGRRCISAFGGPEPLGDTGMVVDWPYLGSSNTLIANQATEKTEVQSARVDISKGEAALLTYAGYSDISYQLLQRSSPSYREAYDRIMLAAWGVVTDAAFAAAVEATSGTTAQTAPGMLGSAVSLATSAHSDDIFDTAAAHGFSAGDVVVFSSLTGGDATTAALVGRPVWVIATSLAAQTFRISLTPGGAAFAWGTADLSAGTVYKLTDTGARLRESLFQASAAIEDATGQPAQVALAGSAMFLALAGLSGIVPPNPAGNPSNASGTALASELTMQVSGLTIVRAPAVSTGKLLVSNQLAAKWHEQGPRFVSSQDVGKLGENVGVYSFGAPAVYVPAGVVELTLV